MRQATLFAAALAAGIIQALSAGVVPCDGDAEFKRAGTLVPRSKPDPKDDQWMIGCEVLDRDFARFSAYKRGPRSRLRALLGLQGLPAGPGHPLHPPAGRVGEVREGKGRVRLRVAGRARRFRARPRAEPGPRDRLRQSALQGRRRTRSRRGLPARRGGTRRLGPVGGCALAPLRGPRARLGDVERARHRLERAAEGR